MSISNRLKIIAAMVTEGKTAADIGTDHGYVPVFLVKEGRVPSAIASDMSRGALNKAIENVQRAGLSDQIDCRLADGLSGISPGEVQSIIISGMGGILMHRILTEGIEVVKQADELILSPHRDRELIKDFLIQNDFEIAAEREFIDKKKNYVVFKGIRRRT